MLFGLRIFRNFRDRSLSGDVGVVGVVERLERFLLVNYEIRLLAMGVHNSRAME